MRRFRLALSLSILASAVMPTAVPAGAEIAVEAKTISQFRKGSDETRFGSLTFLGGIDFTSGDSRVQSLSSIRFRADGRHFVSVLDTGNWLTGAVERNAQGRLSGLSDVAVNPILLRGGRIGTKASTDAEGLALRAGQAVVSFEQQHRVDAYPDPGFEEAPPVASLDFLIPRRELRSNGGIETLVASSVSGRLKGALVAVGERSVDAEGNFLAAILDGPLKGRFSIVRHDPFDATDGAFLPDGDLLLLERRFSYTGGLGMRIRRIKGEDIRPGGVVDGDVLLDADLSYAIDNMEGIDVLAGDDGKPRIILVSDDNGSFFQRNVMLEFRLEE